MKKLLFFILIFNIFHISLFAGWGASSNPKISIKSDEKEDEDNNITFTAELDDDADDDWWFEIDTADDTAVSGDDYKAQDNERYTCSKDVKKCEFTIEIKNDDLYEDDETFKVKIVNHSDNVDDGDPLEETATIKNDDDEPTVSFKENDDKSIEETASDETVTLTLKLNNKSGLDTTIDIKTKEDSAKASSDYDEVDTSFTIPAGDLEKEFSITIKAEEDGEGEEEFEVEITGATNADVTSDDKKTITITNDVVADPKASIEDNSIDETGEDQTLTFTIKLSKNAPSGGSKIDWALADDTATDGEDYVKANGTVTIAQGDSEGTFDVTIKGDDVDEDNSETFTIRLTANENVEIDDGDGVGTINDDDGTNCTKSGTIDLKMKDGYGDAEQQGNSVDHSSSDLEMMYDDSDEQKIGTVFEDVNIEQGCYVKNAYIQFVAKGDKLHDTSVIIFGEDVDNAVNYKDDRKVSEATKTDENVSWISIKDWDDGQNNEDTRTPQISCLVEKILKRENWVENNNMGFIILPTEDCVDEDCSRRAYAGSSDDYKPILHIEYSDNKEDSVPCQIAQDDSYDVRMGETVTLEVTENDSSSVDEDSINIKIEPEHGTYELDGNDVSYTPDDGYKGSDSFIYTVTVNGAESNEANVSLNIALKGGDVEFHIVNPKNTRNIHGNFFIGGNMSLCRADNEDAECESHQGTNDKYMKYIDIDDDSDTYNSSAFTLDLPDESKIIWAGLYWGGFIHNSEDGDDWKANDKIDSAKEYDNGPGIDLADNAYDTDKVKFKHPKTNNYIDVDAKAVYFSKYGFSSFADITNIFNNDEDLQNNPNGEYILANLSTNHKKMENHGNSGGWSMVVVYENENLDYKNVTVFHGWKEVDQDHPVDMNVSGFLIPETADIKAKLSFMSHDGDGGDCTFKLNDTKLGIWIDEAGTEHDDRDEVFNSTIVGVPQKRPDFNLTDDRDDFYSSFEIDSYDANGILEAGDTSANIKMEMGNNAAFEIPLIVFSADMYTPKFCYDYAYKQNNIYFTEENNGTQKPRVIGSVDKDELIDVEIYLRNNEESDLKAVEFTVDIEDINTTQSIYERETTWVTQPNSKKRIAISDDDINVSDEYDKNISINNIGSKDYFYVGYSLDPSTKDINISIDGYAKYNLVLGDKKIILPRVKIGGQRIPICVDNNIYNVTPGLFNVVHNNYYDNADGDKFYNLPTQVTSRQANLDIISLKKNSEELKNRTTIVSVEIVNIDVFHDTQASCDYMANKLGSRLWVTFDNNISKIKFDKDVVPNSFYEKANKNTAFRISFNSDENGSIIELENDDDNYKIKNYDSVINPNDDDCLNENGNKVIDECGEDGDSISKDKLIGCMECIFKRQTISACSRDNFTIRPEALYMKISDQNQTNKTSKNSLNGENLNLASGYNYFMEINATNHKNNDSSKGYNNSLDLNLTWDSSKTGCNDESNSSFKSKFNNGKVTLDIYKNNIGEYNLSILDNSWTNIDIDPIHHHIDNNRSKGASDYFTIENDDCIRNSHIVADTGDSGSDNTPLNGCEISSKHNNTNDDDDTIEYKNYNLTFHPYKFGLDTTIKLSVLGDFIYMSNLKDENMSVILDTNLSAKGYNNIALNNFVTDCYAEDLNMQILKTRTTNGDEEFKYIFHNTEKNGTIISSDDINNTLADADENIVLLLKDNFFKKDRNGTISTKTYLNFDRERDAPQNPESINFTKLIVNNNTDFDADLATKKAETKTSINQEVLFYYGRSHTTRQRYIGDEGTASIIYETYCNHCDKSLLTSTKYTDNPKWFVNIKHDKAEYGTVGNIKQKMSNRITEIDSELESSTLKYDESRGYPYKTTMTHQAPEWLIDDKYNIGINNEFEIEFMRESKSWVGEHKTETTTSSEASRKTNRRIMW